MQHNKYIILHVTLYLTKYISYKSLHVNSQRSFFIPETYLLSYVLFYLFTYHSYPFKPQIYGSLEGFQWFAATNNVTINDLQICYFCQYIDVILQSTFLQLRFLGKNIDSNIVYLAFVQFPSRKLYHF